VSRLLQAPLPKQEGAAGVAQAPSRPGPRTQFLKVAQKASRLLRLHRHQLLPPLFLAAPILPLLHVRTDVVEAAKAMPLAPETAYLLSFSR
jgi:hypothetical protein